MTAPLPGYRQTHLVDPFENFVGPLFEQGEGLQRHYAFRVDERHVNMRGILHGGMLMTLADMVLGQAAWDATDKAPIVTMNMQSQFIRSATIGDLVEVQPELVRRTRALVFLRGDFLVAGETIYVASSVWKILGQ